MGATSAQGWYLFIFIVGFTLAPAGILALGWLGGILGLAMMAGALAGFHSIKEPAAGQTSTRDQVSPAAVRRHA